MGGHGEMPSFVLGPEDLWSGELDALPPMGVITLWLLPRTRRCQKDTADAAKNRYPSVSDRRIPLPARSSGRKPPTVEWEKLEETRHAQASDFCAARPRCGGRPRR